MKRQDLATSAPSVFTAISTRQLRSQPNSVGRVGWVDFAKGVGISLVVFGHVWRGLENGGVPINREIYSSVDRSIYLFHMPLFFVLSGMFLSRLTEGQKFSSYFKSRIEQLIYPFFVWSYISALFRIFAGNATTRGSMSASELFLYPFVASDIYWFLWALFVIQLYIFILDLLPIRLRRLFLAGGVVSSLAVTASGAALPGIGSALYFMPFVALGRALVGRIDQQISFGLGLTGLSAFLGSEVLVNTFQCDRVSSYIASIMAVLGAVLAIACLYRSIVETMFGRIFTALGTLSLPIYLAHVIAASGARVVALRMGINELWVHVVIGCSAGVLCPLFLVWVARRVHLGAILGFEKFSARKGANDPSQSSAQVGVGA